MTKIRTTREWRVGLVMHLGRPVEPIASHFPATIAALSQVPSLRSALFSVMEAGAELGDHVGPNAGVLRYHLGVIGTEGSGLRIDGEVYPYEDGSSILFDDTVVHSGWNRSNNDRVTLFCEVLRTLTGATELMNRLTQALLTVDPRYRRAPQRAVEWHRALNH
ncbi:MAG: aspartyl/asparaginyl beta-hydroxylase domain-containing protein [Microthrixaceae bacterium]